MAKLRVLAGKDLLRIFGHFGFRELSQRGSHIKLRRYSLTGNQTLTIALHSELDRGTLQSIYRQALRYIPERDLRNYFYSE